MPAVKDVGEPCAGEPHARFDGGREETGASRPRRAEPGASRLPDTTSTSDGLTLVKQAALETRVLRVFLLVEGAAGAGVARRAVRLICAGWVPQDRGFVSEPAV